MILVVLTIIFSPLLYAMTALRRGKTIRKILVIQTAKIGDLICSTPVLREIKKRYPSAVLTVMATPVTSELLEHNSHVDEIIKINVNDYKGFSGKARLSSLVRKGRYDAAVCLNPNVLFAVALLWGLVPVRLSVMPDFSGITFGLASSFFTHLEKHVRGVQVACTYMRMLRCIGIESDDTSKEVYGAADSKYKIQQMLKGPGNRPLVGIAVSSGNKLKELGTEKIARLTNMLLDRMDIYVVFIGPAGDTKTAASILRETDKKDRVIDTTGKLGLKELPHLIKKLAFFIGVDSGITYMADALSVPLIDIAGPSDMQDQRPTGRKSVILQKDLACVPCSHAFRSPYSCRMNTRECIETVSVEEIFDTFKKASNIKDSARDDRG